MAAPKPLIFYCPGSRGDFLAAVLTDQIDLYYHQYGLRNNSLDYYKMHSVDCRINPGVYALDETSILKYRNQSIRIKIEPGDYTTVSGLAISKGILDMDVRAVGVWETMHRRLDIKFKYIIKFADLFDIDFLKKFYQEFNGRPMPAEVIPLIEHNIALQLNYKP